MGQTLEADIATKILRHCVLKDEINPADFKDLEAFFDDAVQGLGGHEPIYNLFLTNSFFELSVTFASSFHGHHI